MVAPVALLISSMAKNEYGVTFPFLKRSSVTFPAEPPLWICLHFHAIFPLMATLWFAKCVFFPLQSVSLRVRDAEKTRVCECVCVSPDQIIYKALLSSGTHHPSSHMFSTNPINNNKLV